MKYSTQGFRLVHCIDDDGLKWHPAAAVSITKGDVLFDDGAGYATNVGTAFAATFLGVANATVDNSGGAAGDLRVPAIPPREGYAFWVKNESATVATQTDVNEIIDLDSNDGVDVTDVTVTAWGFQVDEIDISANALAANAGGFVKGRFVRQ